MFGFGSTAVLLVVVAGFLIMGSGQALRIFRSDFGGNFKMMAMAALAAVGMTKYWSVFSGPDVEIKSTHAAQMAQRLVLALPELPGRPKVAVAPFQRDHQDQLTGLVRDRWVGRNVQLVAPTLTQQVFDLINGREGAGAEIELGRAINQRDCQYILCGEVLEWTTFPTEQAKLRVRVQLFEVETSRSLFDQTFIIPEPRTQKVANQTVPHVIDQTVEQFAEWGTEPFVMGVLTWLTITLLAPWFMAGAVRRTLDRESNGANAVLLMVFTILSAAVAWLSWGRLLSVDSAWFVIVIAVVISVPYFGFVCGRINETRAG